MMNAKETNITCSECRKTLGKIIEKQNKKEFDAKRKYNCVCPCGNEAYTIETDGPAFVFLEEGYKILDMKTEFSDTIITMVRIGRV